MSDTQTRLDVTSREFLEAWLVGADFPMAATVKLLLGAHDARVAELERVTAALREIVEQDPVENALDPQWSARIASDALTDVARAAQEDK
jgi:predicted transcriptional regulator